MFDPRTRNRRDLFTHGVENLLNKAANALDLTNPLAFLGLDRSYTRLTRTAMFTDMQVLYGAYESVTRQKTGMEILDEIDRFDAMLNIWRSETELSQLNQTAHRAPVPVSPELFAMIKLAWRYYHRTQGAFDITTTPLVRLWGFFERNPRVPSLEAIRETRKRVGMHLVELDEEMKTVYFKTEGVEMTPASMGKGVALDYAMRVAHQQGLTDVLLNGGFSSVLASGAPAWKDHWQFDIRNPLDHTRPLAALKLRDQGFSTSGSELQSFEHEGRTYGHIIDPRTGWPARTMLNVSVLAPTAAEAEVLSTSFYVMGVEKTLEYCENHKNIGVIILSLPDAKGKHEIITANINRDTLEVLNKSC
ncbi:MAG: FAD:protein FMN transferase [bacterium]|nr:FAD:protein FMN transferase [bacterium]